MQICQGCEREKPIEDFPKRKDRSGRRRPYCLECAKKGNRSRYAFHRKNNPFRHRCSRAKTRAKALGVSFDLDPEYLENMWTGECPVLGLPINIVTDRSDEMAAELDRFVPELGYVKGNVHWLSRRINRLKNNVTVTELKDLIEWMEKYDKKC